MKIVDKICQVFGLYGEEDENDIIDDSISTDDGKVVPMFATRKWSEKDNRSAKRDHSFFSSKHDDDKLISMPMANKPVKVMIVEPRNFDDAQRVADFLRKNQPVVINFEDTNSELMKRIIDFVSGTVYALNGSMKKIGRSIIVAAPQNVDIDAADTSFYKERGGNPWQK